MTKTEVFWLAIAVLVAFGAGYGLGWWMRTGCRHRWIVETEVFTPPTNKKLTTYDENTLRYAVFGFTTYVQRCEICGKRREDTGLGDLRDK